MKTETLNEYLFADLVAQWGRAAQQRRVSMLRTSGAITDKEETAQIIEWASPEDLAEGFRMLEQRRREALALLQGSPPA